MVQLAESHLKKIALLLSRLAFAIGLVASLAVLNPVAEGQTEAFSASLTGVVHDASEAPITGAKVTVANSEKGISRSFTTDPGGRYSFALLPPGTYSLVIEATGFSPYKAEGIQLGAGQASSESITLQVRQVQTQVTVSESQAPLLATENANVSSDLNEQQVQQLPVNLRNVFGLVLLNSSVNNSTQVQLLNGGGQSGTADQDISFLNFGGGYFGTTAYLLDGHWDTAADWGGVIYVPSMDSVQEAKIQTNGFTAQYGWSTGNVYNVVTRSGASSFHGDAYEFLRNDKLDANFFFSNANGIARAPFHRNQFGIVGGGPVYIPKLYEQRNKTFFFFAYEGLRQSSPVTYTTTVPTQAETNGDFSAIPQALYDPFSTRQTANGFTRTPFAGNQIPVSRMSAVARNLITYYPQPTTGGLANNFVTVAPAPTASDEYSGRLDHNFTDEVRSFFRFSEKNEYKVGNPAFYGADDPGGPGLRQPNDRLDGATGLTWVITPTTVLSLNFGLNHWVEGNAVQAYPFDMTRLGLPAFLNPTSNQFPVVDVSGYAPLGPQNGSGEGDFPRNTYTSSASLSKVIGAHSLSAGFMNVILQSGGGRIYPTTFNFSTAGTAGPNPQTASPDTSGNAIASLLLGVGTNSGPSGLSSSGVSVLPYNSKHYYGTFFEDDWKITRNLTLNLGLRWEYQTAPVERFNQQSFFDFNAVNPISSGLGSTVRGAVVFNGVNGVRRGLYNASATDFSPRIGLAYQAASKLVVRAGFGTFYVPSYYGGGSTQGFGQATPWVAVQSDGFTPQNTLDNAFPNGLLPQTGSSLGATTNVGFNTSGTESHRPDPYMIQWMTGVQYAVSGNDMIDVSYVGTRGVHIQQGTMNFNQLPTADLALGNQLLQQVANPFYGKITSSGCDLSSKTVAYGQLLRPYPEFCDVTISQVDNSWSLYNALQVNYNRRWSSGLQVLASYTFSKFMDDTSGTNGWAQTNAVPIRNYYNLAVEKSVDAADITHSAVISYIYELPVGRGKKWGANFSGVTNAVLGGWQVTGVSSFKSGFPLGVVGGVNNTGSFGGNQRPDVVGNPKVSHQTLEQWFNTSAFAQPAPFTFGNAPRYMSTVRAPGLETFDIGIQKWFSITEYLKLQFRAEMFNAFNRANFYAPDANFNDAAFGRISATLPPRDVQFGLKLYW
jgi:Carboxypeptidase regulatory-like domain/TonB dependent receptor